MKCLQELKNKSGMTYNEISEKSCVPLTTVTRIFNGETSNPSIWTVGAMVVAMGGDLNKIIADEIKAGTLRVNCDLPEDQAKEDLVVNKKDRCPYHEEMVSIYTAFIKKKNEDIKYKNNWLKAAFLSNLISWGTIVTLFIVDLLAPATGFMRF